MNAGGGHAGFRRLGDLVDSRPFKSNSYRVYLNPSAVPEEIELPNEMSVSEENFYKIEKGSKVRFELARGRLGYPWYRSIRFFAKD